MPNGLAYLMLLIWPFVAVLLFRRLDPARAFIWTILGGYLVLPPIAYFDLPVLPDMDKVAIPNICAYLGIAATRGSLPKLMPATILGKLALAFFVLSPVGTVITNADPVVFAVGGLPGLSVREIPGSVLSQLVLALPLLLARSVLQDEKAIRELFVAMVIAGLIYSIPMLIEVRLSPQINVWVYGFFQHSFDQMMRYGGYRPIVFLPHGLWVAMFAYMVTLAAITMLKNEPLTTRSRYFFISVYLLVVLVLCKSANAIIYIVLFAPTVLFLSRRMQVRIAAVMAGIVLLYPLLRGAGLIPIDWLTNQAEAMDAERASSLIYRLRNEDILLAHAGERPWFGWGGWERNLVHNMQTGGATTVTDGRWIIAIGMSGWFGYLGEFGLLTLPLFALAAAAWRRADAVSAYAAALALILGANLFDLIPNATLVPFTWLLAGAIWGYAEQTSTAPAAVKSPIARANARRPAPWARPPADGKSA